MNTPSPSPAGTGLSDLISLFAKCKGAYSENTLRSYRADLAAFIRWCEANQEPWLPADPEAVARYIDAIAPRAAVSTLERRLCAIRFAHAMNDLPSPNRAAAVQLALRRAHRRTCRRPDQAKPITAEVLRTLLAGMPNTLAGKRDAAVIAFGYDTLCRSQEIAELELDDLQFSEAGDCRVLVRRSKADPSGDGRVAWLSPDTTARLHLWLEAALCTGRASHAPLDTSSIRRLVKRAGKRIAAKHREGPLLSGHSMRVGAAQDMLVAGFDMAAIMQAGGWKSPNVLARYVENAATREVHQKRWRTIG